MIAGTYCARREDIPAGRFLFQEMVMLEEEDPRTTTDVLRDQIAAMMVIKGRIASLGGGGAHCVSSVETSNADVFTVGPDASITAATIALLEGDKGRAKAAVLATIDALRDVVVEV